MEGRKATVSVGQLEATTAINRARDAPSTVMVDVLQKLKGLDDKEYQSVLVEAFDNQRSYESLKKVSNAWLDKVKKTAKKIKKDEVVVGGGATELQGKATSSPSSSAQLSLSRSAWKVPIIYCGDLVLDGGHVFIDVEKVSLKLDQMNLVFGKKAKHSQKAATVAVVNEKNDLILWAFIKRDKICPYFPSITRLDRSKLNEGVDLTLVQTLLTLCFKNNRVVGLAVINDLLSLDMSAQQNFEDLQDFYNDESGPYSAKSLAKAIMKNDEYQCGAHSAISDARLTRDLFYKKEELIRQGLRCPKLERVKAQAFVFNPSDICKCKRNPYK